MVPAAGGRYLPVGRLKNSTSYVSIFDFTNKPVENLDTGTTFYRLVSNVLSPFFTFVKLQDEIETKHNHQQPIEVTIRVPSLVVDTKQNEQQ